MPPSSIETRRICSADCSISVRPTSVEPVNDSLRVRGSLSSGSITAPECLAVITFSTPFGQAGLLEDLREREHRQRRLLRRLDDHRAARRDRRGDLAGAHRRREVPGRHEHARPHRLAHREDAALAGRVDHVAAVDADGLLGEPAQELGRIGDLRPRFGHAPCPSRASSAAPGRRSARRSPRTRGAGSRHAHGADDAPTRPGARPPPTSAARASSTGASATSTSVSPVDGILDRERPACRSPPPLSTDVQVGREPLEHLPLAARRQSSCSAHGISVHVRPGTHGPSPSGARPWRRAPVFAAARMLNIVSTYHRPRLRPVDVVGLAALAVLAGLLLRAPEQRRRAPRRS